MLHNLSQKNKVKKVISISLTKLAAMTLLFFSPLFLPKGPLFEAKEVLGEACAQNGFNKMYTVKSLIPLTSAGSQGLRSILTKDQRIVVIGNPGDRTVDINDPYLMCFDKNGVNLFSKYYRSNSPETQYGSFTKHFSLPDGGFIIGGPFVKNYSYSNFSNPKRSALTLRVDKSGAVRYFNCTETDSGTFLWNKAIMTRESDVVTVGDYFSSPDSLSQGSDISLFSIDTNGLQKWGKIFNGPKGAPAKALSGTQEFITSLDTVSDGGIAMVGLVQVYHPDMFLPGTGDINDANWYYHDALIAKTDVSGKLIWSKAFHVKTPAVSGLDAIVNANGVNFTRVISTSDGGFLVSGAYAEYTARRMGPMIAKFDKDGNLLWMKVYRKTGSNLFDRGWGRYSLFPPINEMEELSDGYLFNVNRPVDTSIPISFPGDTLSSIFLNPEIVIKTDFNGKMLWAKTNSIKKAHDPTGKVLPQSIYNQYVYNKTNALLYAQTVFNTKPRSVTQAYIGYNQWGYGFGPTDASSIRLDDYDSFTSFTPPFTQRDSSIKLTNSETGISVYYADGDSLKKWLTGYESCLVDPLLDTFNIDINNWIQVKDDVLMEKKDSISTHTISYNAFDLPILRTLNRRDTLYCDGSKTYALHFAANNGCAGKAVSFTDNSFGYYYYHWNFGDPASGNENIATIPYPTHIYQNTGTYTVTLTAYSKDSTTMNTFSATVSIIPDKFITVSGDVSICSGKSTVLSVGGATSYNGNYWQPAVALSDSTIINPKASPTSTITYMITGSNGNCTDTGKVTVKVLSSPTVIAAGNRNVCLGSSTTLSASGSENIFSWSTGASTASISVQPLKDTVYSVSVSKGSCTISQTYTLTVVSPTINPIPNQTIIQGAQIILTASSIGGDDIFQWSPSTGLSCTQCPSPFANPATSTVYYITMKDANGCVSEDSVVVFVNLPCGEVFVPSAFSPNNDNANEVLYTKNECLQQMVFKIYDRWGNKVFEATNAKEGWDGTYNGKAMDPAVFVYSLQATLSSGEVLNRKGNIVLMR